MINVDVAQNLHEVLGNLPDGVRLVAISKYHPSEYIMAAYNAGQRVCGESHEQELKQKVAELPSDIEWHFIGHLQTNKVKYIAPYISMMPTTCCKFLATSTFITLPPYRFPPVRTRVCRRPRSASWSWRHAQTHP